MSSRDETIEQLTQIVESNMGNERFGVEELAEAFSVSRSTLLRTLKKHTGLSANLFIKEVRLEQAAVMLAESDKTIAEISFETGFSSPSYFIKCFKEKYGHPPGELRQVAKAPEPPKAKKKSIPVIALGLVVGAVLILAVAGILLINQKSKRTEFSGKSIAVLPFKNESGDSSNVYFVNGMMESILSHLQKIEDIRVISRTSVEKYRNMNVTTPQIALDLNVDYVLEGSGQKAGNDILLTVQLIEASEDRHLWSNQYKRELADVFKLQAEISKRVASEIEVVIRPSANDRIESVPTGNLEAYDLYLKGLEFTKIQTQGGLDSAISYFQQAIALDEQFAHPHAYVAICYYFMDMFKVDKTHLKQVDSYADKALLLDSELPEALIARGMYYMLSAKYEDAKDYFEKVLEYNPNSAWTHNFLSEIYHRYLPDTEKYLIHALLALQLDFSQADSIDTSISHLILANAFSQSGILDKAKHHVQVSLDYDPKNTFSRYLDIYVDVARAVESEQEIDMNDAISRMQTIYEDDTTRLDVLKELATLYYGQEDYQRSLFYFEKFLQKKELYGLNLFPEQDITVAFILRELGNTTRAETYRAQYGAFVDQDITSYKPFLRSMGLLYDGRKQEAISAFEEFSEVGDILYWFLLLRDDPIFASIKDDPRFLAAHAQMRSKFEATRQARIMKLKELGLWE